MSNSWFQFKQFTIRQDRCAMKVCTDACILGARFGAWSAGGIAPEARVLDIGSGTGLLMCMLAQRHMGRIQGIELDPAAFGQLQENIAQSPWKERLTAFEGDARDFGFGDKFDFIITNPPFFEDDLPAASETKNLARHGKALRLSELIAAIDRNLEPSGSFGILLPYHREQYFVNLATGQDTRSAVSGSSSARRHGSSGAQLHESSGVHRHPFYLQELLRIRQRPGQDFFRSILRFTRNEENMAQGRIGGFAIPAAELIIHNEDGSYTPAFVELMKDYYLHL